MTGAGLMTVGELSRRTGTPARALRAWTDLGLVYSRIASKPISRP